MINFEDCVQISDDDTVVETEENRRPSLYKTSINEHTKRRSLSTDIDTIVIEDDYLSQRNNNSENNNVIEINDSDCIQNNTKSHITFFDKIYRENKTFADFIEKCLDLENSEGMLRIINKNLTRVYKDCDEVYKKSPEFKKVLIKAINLLETDPAHKFSHLKTLCDALRLHAKKRATLITLATNIKDNRSSATLKRKNEDFTDTRVKRPNKEIIIDVDDEPKDVTVINLDEYQTDVIVLDEPIEVDCEKENLVEAIRETDEKEDIDVGRLLKAEAIKEIGEEVENEDVTTLVTETTNIHNDKEGIIRTVIDEAIEKNVENENHQGVARILIPEPTERIDEENRNNIINEQNSEDSRFLIVQVEVPWKSRIVTGLSGNSIVTEIKEVPITFEPDSSMVDAQKIKAIEDQIALYNEVITKLEEAEVCDDTVESPYIKSEKFKAKIVALYKELCTLTGELPVKRREVRLQVREGHPSGAARLLETFINDNIGSDGVPPFPDFGDVVRCVIEANEADGLCWTKAQIVKEACALFTQCGRALQKQRQRREWRDLLGSVRVDSVEDPADEDPSLQAKLQDNRRVAVEKEREIIERYAMMGTRAAKTKPKTSSGNVDPKPSEVDHLTPAQGEHLVLAQEGECLLQAQGERLLLAQGEHLLSTQEELPESDLTPNQFIEASVEMTCIKAENIVNINLESQLNSNLQSNIDSKTRDPSNFPVQGHEMILQAPVNFNSKDHDAADSNLESNINSTLQSNVNSRLQSDDSNLESPEVKVKKEPIDVAALLEELGDNYSVSILDIEDPFLVIEISSDSSDED